jgi:hypothetical protein
MLNVKPGPMRLDIAGLLTQPDDDAMIAHVLDVLGLRHQENRRAITRPDNEHVMGIFPGGCQPHPYDEWLLTTVANILDHELRIGSAGLLREGAVTWVSVEMEDNVKLPEGGGVPPVPAGHHQLRPVAVDHVRPQGHQCRLPRSLGKSLVGFLVVGFGIWINPPGVGRWRAVEPTAGGRGCRAGWRWSGGNLR